MIDVKLTPCEGVVARCAICHDDAPEQALVCPGCGTLVHAECPGRGGCPTLGCPQRSRPDQPLECKERWTFRRALLPWFVLGVVGLLLWSSLTVNVMTPGYTSRLLRVQADMHAFDDAYPMEPVPRDPWGHEYVYFYNSPRHCVVLSLGADGKPGGEGEDADLSSRTIDGVIDARD